MDRRPLKSELQLLMQGSHTFGKQKEKVDLGEFFQTLEEGFESADNLVSSCEVLQFMDYDVDVKRYNISIKRKFPWVWTTELIQRFNVVDSNAWESYKLAHHIQSG